ncbi:MAG: hypothetical protein ABI051_16765 [Vicinamibacterales bacterium]
MSKPVMLCVDDDQEVRGADALSIFIGVAPRTNAFAPHVATDDQGFLLTGADARAAARSASIFSVHQYLRSV